jgi:hypothetical protein
MPPPRTTDHDDEELVRYILGLLPDEARERLDEASIVDDGIAARLRTAETDLIDSYVRGQLTGATLERFESYFLSSPRRRESVRLAESFLSVVDRSVARAEPVTRKDRIVRPSRFAWMAAVAALAMVTGVIFLFPAVRARPDVVRVTAENGVVERRASEPASPSSPPASVSPGGKREAPPERIVAVVLPPPTRAVAPIPVLAVPAGVDRVRFELQLEANDFPSYRVGLKDPATNQILWRSDWIGPRSSADQVFIVVVVPANLLGPQHYSLDLAGRGAGGGAEVIGSYTVRVVQR